MRAAAGFRSPAAWILVALTAIAAIAGGCTTAASTAGPSVAPLVSTAPASPSGTDSGAPTDTAAAPVVPESPVAGIVIAVESAGLDQVKGFTMRTNAGDTIVFKIGTLDNADEFPAGHLKEHQASSSPVFVFFRQENGQLVVYHLEDAP